MKLLLGPGLRDPAGHEAFLVKALKRAADVVTFDDRSETFDQALDTLPPGWTPDAIVIRDAEFYKMPSGLERAPWPVFGLVGDYNLSLGRLLPVLGCFDYFFCDAKGVRIFNKLGFDNCDFLCLYGFDPEAHRDFGEQKLWDIVFIGNLNHAVQQEREEHLCRLAALAGRYRVRIDTGLYGEPYARQLNRAHLVFNTAIRDEANMRFFEACACGATVMSPHLEELDRLGFYPDEHYLAYRDPCESAVRYFEEWPAAKKAALRENVRQALAGHTYDDRAEDLLRRIAATPVDLSARRLAQCPPDEAARRWQRYRSDAVALPGGSRVGAFDPVLVQWQKKLVRDELAVQSLDFAMWWWWAELLAVSGLDTPLAEFLAEREAVLSAFACYRDTRERVRAMLNKLLYGFCA